MITRSRMKLVRAGRSATPRCIAGSLSAPAARVRAKGSMSDVCGARTGDLSSEGLFRGNSIDRRQSAILPPPRAPRLERSTSPPISPHWSLGR